MVDVSRLNALSLNLFSALPSASTANGLLAAARASSSAARNRSTERLDFTNIEGKARLAEQRAKNFSRLSSKLERTTAAVTDARDTLVDIKKLLSDMRKQIVLAQSTTIDDSQRAIHADTFDQLLGQLNIKVRNSGGIEGNIIGSSIRDVFTPSTLTYKTKPDSPIDQTVTGVFSGSDYFITDGNGDNHYPGIFGAVLTKFPTEFGDEGQIVSDTDTVVYDSDTGSISLTRDGEASPYLSGTLERKGLGVVNSFLYGNFTDPDKLDEALADLDAASSKLRFDITIVETQLTKVTTHRDFNTKLIEEHNALATNVQQQALLEQTQKALEEQKQTLLFNDLLQSALSFDGGGNLLSLSIQRQFDESF